ncbi:MAG: hypothetical protein Q9183_006707 [Haloplaca sp. 2 TL-2023]
MAESLIKYRADLNTAPAFTVSYLRNAAVFGDERMIRLFDSAKPAIDVDLKDPQGCTAEDRMRERMANMAASDPRKDGLAAAFAELVDVCRMQYERLSCSPPPAFEKVKEVSDDEAKPVGMSEAAEEDVFQVTKEVLQWGDRTAEEETFYDALEELEIPTPSTSDNQPPVSTSPSLITISEEPTPPTTSPPRTQPPLQVSLQRTHQPPPPLSGTQTTDWANRHKTPYHTEQQDPHPFQFPTRQNSFPRNVQPHHLDPFVRDTDSEWKSTPVPRASSPAPMSRYGRFRQRVRWGRVQEVA